MLKVAFIDDGIMREAEGLPNEVKKYKIYGSNLEKCIEKENLYYLSHGTMCFWVFDEYINERDYLLYDIEIIDSKTGNCKIDYLKKALELCLKENVDIINMSLGSVFDVDCELEGILKRIYERGTIMVAAQNNDGLITYPACSRYVYGVERDYMGILLKDQYCIQQKKDNINIISHCDFSKVEMEHGIVLGKYNSFSTPFITALVYNELVKGKKRQQLINILEINSTANYQFESYEYKKATVRNWYDELTIPIVGVICEESLASKHVRRIVNIFRNEEYNAIGVLRTGDEENDCPYILSYDNWVFYGGDTLEKVVRLVVNLTNADIIFVETQMKDVRELSEIADLILDTTEDSKLNGYISIKDKNNEEIMDIIKNMFGE